MFEKYKFKNIDPNRPKIEILAGLIAHFMDVLGIEENDSTEETPLRVAKMYLNELCSGLDPNTYPKIKVQENSFKYDQMLIEVGIKVHSLCEHHLIPIIGHCHLAYIPKDKILGLSKFNRIVNYWSRRPQVQERLTENISMDLRETLGTDDIAVIIDAVHLCVKVRGIKDQTAKTRTSSMLGLFREDIAVRQEFLNSIPKLNKGE